MPGLIGVLALVRGGHLPPPLTDRKSLLGRLSDGDWMKVREKCLTGNPKTTTDGVGVSAFSGIYPISSLDVVSWQ